MHWKTKRRKKRTIVMEDKMKPVATRWKLCASGGSQTDDDAGNSRGWNVEKNGQIPELRTSKVSGN